jgi:membrane protein implicated in regulation of membrane protease activity
MTAEERAALAESLARGSASPGWWGMAGWLAIGLAMVVVEFRVFGGGLGWLIPFAARLPNWGPPLVGAIPPVVMFWGPILWLVSAGMFFRAWRKVRAKKEFEQTRGPQIREALEDGRAVVCRVGAVGVIVVEQSQDDLGSIVIYNLGDGRSFVMWSHDFYYLDDRNFTARLPQQFEIVRTAAHGLWLGLTNCEGQLEAELKIWDEDMPEETLDRRNMPTSESVVFGGPREVLARWGYEENLRGAGC